METTNHISEIVKIYSPLLYVIGAMATAITGLLVWAWKKLEKAQEHLVITLETHTRSDDSIHDELFNRVREMEEILTRCAAFHEINHPGQKLK